MKKLMIVSVALVVASAHAGWGDLGKTAVVDTAAAVIKSVANAKSEDAKCEKGESEQKACNKTQETKSENNISPVAQEQQGANSGVGELDKKIMEAEANLKQYENWQDKCGIKKICGLEIGANRKDVEASGVFVGNLSKMVNQGKLKKQFRGFNKVILQFTKQSRLCEITMSCTMSDYDTAKIEADAVHDIFQKKFGKELGEAKRLQYESAVITEITSYTWDKGVSLNLEYDPRNGSSNISISIGCAALFCYDDGIAGLEKLKAKKASIPDADAGMDVL